MYENTLFPFVVLESIDGCGKTSISHNLASILGATLVKSPVEPLDAFRKVYDDCGNYTARYLYYLSTQVVSSARIAELRKSGPVVCDRYLPSTVLYHRAFGVDTSVVDTDKLGLEIPSLMVCLTCREDIRWERICSRGEDKDDHIEDNLALLAKVDKMMRLEIPLHVDTSFTTPREAALQIAAML